MMKASHLTDYFVAPHFLNAHVSDIHCASKNTSRLVLGQMAGFHRQLADYFVHVSVIHCASKHTPRLVFEQTARFHDWPFQSKRGQI